MTKRANYIPWYDILCALAGSSCFFYYAINLEKIISRAVLLNRTDIIMGVVGIVLLFELCRRVVGLPIICVAGAFIVYAFIDGYSLRRVVHQLFYTLDGVLGTPIGVCSTFVVLFVFLAAFLEKSGIAQFFIDLANSITGAFAGGPAKVAVVCSAMLALISGSSVANTVGSGPVTIPTMKRVGYKPHFAAAVEASSSTGGQIMPPIMGAAAFIMAEMTDIPYTTIALSALFPAVLYFVGIFVNVHFEAKKQRLMGLPRDQLPRFLPLFIAKGFLFLPLVILIVMMANGFTPAKAACVGIGTAFLISFIRKDTRFTPARLVDALSSGSRNTLSIGMACAVAGTVVGIVTLTGIGQLLLGKLTGVVNFPLFVATGTSLIVALVITMLTCLILGMGIPTTANYVIMATITAPMVVRAGLATGLEVPILSAHMFVFYYGLLADVTPPVALASYAASAIARCDPMKTALKGTQLALTAFIVPYMFIFNPAMLMIGATPLGIIQMVITACLGMFAFGAGLVGYMLRPIGVPLRLISIATGIMLVDPTRITDILGIGLLVLIIAVQVLQGKKEKAALERR
jgi:TRAP transporter 4TM/12TM fusion protein